jgi:type IV secretion system protein VirB4
MDDILSVISASTDNIDVMHRVLQTAAVRNRVTVDELSPEQWLEDFYRNRKGSGKEPRSDAA